MELFYHHHHHFRTICCKGGLQYYKSTLLSIEINQWIGRPRKEKETNGFQAVFPLQRTITIISLCKGCKPKFHTVL